MRFFPPLLLLLSPFFISCSERRSVRIAVAVPLTGDIAAEGQGILRAVRLALEMRRDARKSPVSVEVVPFDDRADPDQAVHAANLIAADPRIVAVIGHYNSGCAIPAARVYAGASLAMISPSATNPLLTLQQLEPGWGRRNVFRMTPTDEVQGSFAAEYAVEAGLRRFLLVQDGTPYGKGIAQVFQKRLEALGGKIARVEEISLGQRDFSPVLQRAKSAKPQALYCAGLYPECGLLLLQARKAGLGAAFFSGDGSRTEGFLQIAGDRAEGALLTALGATLDSTGPAADFVAAFKRRYPGSEIKAYDPFAYDAAGLLLTALERAGPERSRVLQALRSTRHWGAVGLTAFDDKGDTRLRSVRMMRVEKGRFMTLRTASQ